MISEVLRAFISDFDADEVGDKHRHWRCFFADGWALNLSKI